MTVQELLDDKKFWDWAWFEIQAHVIDIASPKAMNELHLKPNCLSLFLYHMRCHMAATDGTAHAYDGPTTPRRQEVLGRDAGGIRLAD